MYGKFGLINDAKRVFNMNESRRNCACWNAMLTSLVQNGCLVEAVKFLYQMRAAGVQPQELWLNKLSLKHKNLASIVGFCDENNEKIIIKKRQSRGSLGNYIEDPFVLTWVKRLEICVDLAHALSYIHNDEPRDFSVIHRNIDSCTVLLNDNWEPKLSYFELSMKIEASQRHHIFHTDKVWSTDGYTDPVYIKTKSVNHKSDMYSLGIVLFELLCGRKSEPIYTRTKSVNPKSDKYLAPLAIFHYREKTLSDLIDPDLWKQMAPQSFSVFAETAYDCLNEERSRRPDICEAVTRLEKALELQIADLGLSKFGPANQKYTFLVSNAVGTIGYCDPLYVETGLLTKESDVYSFGVVLFELLCGRLSISNNRDERQPLTELVRKCYKQNTIDEIIYGNIKDEINPHSLKAFITIAYQCLMREQEQRPLMTKVSNVPPPPSLSPAEPSTSPNKRPFSLMQQSSPSETEDEPKNYKEASSDQKWIEAMKVKLDSINRNNTWELTTLPTGHKAIGLKWVFKTKKDANRDIIKHKAILVAKGYIQQHGIDFEEVFAPVARMETIRLLLATAATNKWEVHHLDVKSAFLHGDLKEESLDFKKCALEQAIYTKTSKDSTLLIGVYVDDLIIIGAPKKKIDKFKAQMEEKFKMSDLGLLAYYLGIEVTQTNVDISIKQSAYASKILKEVGMLDCNETLIPMDPGTRLTKITEGTMVNSTEYRSIIGCLRYLLHTRPDLSYSVILLSRFMQEPREKHMKAIRQVLRYVKGTKDYGITYKHNGGNKIHGFSDSSYGVNTQEGNGTTGIIFYCEESPMSWSTQKQATVALSSCESEFIAATRAATQALWLKRLLSKLTHSQEEKITIQVDNKSAIALMKNHVFHGRSKHIDTKYHFIRECVEREDIQVEFVNGEYQKADILTKALPKIKFLTMRQLIGLKDLSHSAYDWKGEYWVKSGQTQPKG
nr:ribonuclease H-like domain, reverse transcriptase, RNA-dependent DNA polymerase [Tanacetum cinerariifolium]